MTPRTMAVVLLACGGAVVASAAAAAARDSAPPKGGKVIATIPIPRGPGGIAVGEGAVWATSDTASTLARIDPRTNDVAARIKLRRRKHCPAAPASCGEAAAGNGAIWISNTVDNTVTRVDPKTNKIVATVPVGPKPADVAVSPGAVWVSNDGGPSVSRIDPKSNKVVATIRLADSVYCCAGHQGITFGAGAVWVGVPLLSAVVRVNAATNAVTAKITLPEQPLGGLAVDSRAVWAAAAHGGHKIWRIDPRSNRKTGAVKAVFSSPITVALGSGSLWVADLDEKSIDRIDPASQRVIGRLRVGGLPIRVRFESGALWVRDDSGRVLRITPQR